MKVSNCCGARGDYKSEYYDPTFQQLELCPKCGEHCEYVEEDLDWDEPAIKKQKTALMELILFMSPNRKDRYKDPSLCDIQLKAYELLQKERQQIEEAHSKGLSKNCFYGVNRQAQKEASDYYNKTYKQ